MSLADTDSKRTYYCAREFINLQSINNYSIVSLVQIAQNKETDKALLAY